MRHLGSDLKYPLWVIIGLMTAGWVLVLTGAVPLIFTVAGTLVFLGARKLRHYRHLESGATSPEVSFR